MLAKRKLAILTPSETRIVERSLPVEEKHEAILETLHAIGIVLALVILGIGHMRRSVALAKVVGVMAMNRMIDIGIVPEMLHDINFATILKIFI